MADIRIYKMLPEMLGRQFYAKKMFPCPVKVHGFESDKELETHLNKLSQKATFMPGNGPNYSIKVGKISQKPADIQKNVMDSCLGHALAHVTCWDEIDFSKVCQISLKISSANGIELPVYNSLAKEDIDAYMNSV